MDKLKIVIQELLDWENKSDVLDFKFQHDSLLVWPLIRYVVFSSIINNRCHFQPPHATKERLSIYKKIEYLYRTLRGNPFFLRRSFDFLFFCLTVGINIEINKKWLGRTSGYFILEYNEKSLALDLSNRVQYKFPRVPKNVCCYDFIKLVIFLKSKIFGKINNTDSKTIENLINYLKMSFGDQLKESDYIFFENTLKIFNLRMPYAHDLYLRLFNKIKPKILFIEDASYGGMVSWVIKWAKESGIITCEPQHGCIDVPYIYSDALYRNKEYDKYLPDYLLMYGSYWADITRTSSKKVIIGSPYFNIQRQKLIGTQENKDCKTILIVSQGTITHIMVDLTSKLAQMLKGKKYEIIFRLHSGEVPFNDRYDRLYEIENVVIDKESGIYELVNAADYVVGSYSLTLFESVGLGKKNYILEDEASSVYVPQNIGVRFKNVDELYDLIISDKYEVSDLDVKTFWADNWKENYHNFINSVLKDKEECLC